MIFFTNILMNRIQTFNIYGKKTNISLIYDLFLLKHEYINIIIYSYKYTHYVYNFIDT